MVKKLIAGLLKKKEEASSDDIPEELPPLAEDVLSQSSSEKQGPAQSAAPKQEPPEELPSLDIEEPAPAPLPRSVEAMPSSLPDLDSLDIPAIREPERAAEVEPSVLPDAILRAKAAKQEVEAEKLPQRLVLDPSQVADMGFFSSVLDHIKSKEGSKEKLLGGDLFARMSNYWELKRGNIKQGMPSKSEQLLELSINKKLEDLKLLEQKWQVQKMALDEDLKFLHDREHDIQAKVEELKKLTAELNLFKNVDPKHYFHMQNGIILRNLHDLLDVLEIIDADTFTHHVSQDKNDFADWVFHVLKNRKFSDKMRKAQTKEEMISLLEEDIPMAEQKSQDYKNTVTPDKYFFLANGIVIKSLYQLADAMQVMEEQLFEKHVSPKHNDFALWVKESVKSDELAAKLELARTRKEMCKILEVYL